MKLTRNVDIDIIDIDALHQKYDLDHKILIKRYLEEFFYIGSQKDLDLKYLATIERLFGLKTAKDHQLKILKKRQDIIFRN